MRRTALLFGFVNKNIEAQDVYQYSLTKLRYLQGNKHVTNELDLVLRLVDFSLCVTRVHVQAHLLFPPGVKRACCDFLESQLDPSNCLGIRDFAETHNCLDLMQAAELFSQKHFSEVVQHEEFMLLSQTEVEKLIKCDEIQVGHWNVKNSNEGAQLVKLRAARMRNISCLYESFSYTQNVIAHLLPNVSSQVFVQVADVKGKKGL